MRHLHVNYVVIYSVTKKIGMPSFTSDKVIVACNLDLFQPFMSPIVLRSIIFLSLEIFRLLGCMSVPKLFYFV